jgi:hypothetical protein
VEGGESPPRAGSLGDLISTSSRREAREGAAPSVKMAVIFGVLGILFLLGAVAPTTLRFGRVPELWLMCLWPASVYLLAAAIYTVDPALGVYLLGKRAEADGDGGLPLWVVVLFAPFFAVMWGVWYVRHTTCVPLSGENPYDRVADGLYVGRWPLRYPSEFPGNCPNWIDLTAEFPARRSVMRGRRYVCLPAMDCTLPENEALLSLAHEAAGWDGDIYISCANGHGRSACLAALILLIRGQATDWRAAFRDMKKHRPAIGIQRNQTRTMDDLNATLLERGLVPAARGLTTRGSSGVVELTTIGKAHIFALQQQQQQQQQHDRKTALVLAPSPGREEDGEQEEEEVRSGAVTVVSTPADTGSDSAPQAAEAAGAIRAVRAPEAV